MDLTQNKLTKSEWDGIEIPVKDNEKFILSLINAGSTNVSIKRNMNESIMSLIKIDYSPELESFLYITYFQPDIMKMVEKYAPALAAAAQIPQSDKKKKPNSKDTIRLNHTESTIKSKKDKMFEFKLLELCNNALSTMLKTSEYTIHIYTLVQLLKTSIPYVNKHMIHFTEALINWTIASKPQLISDMIHNSQTLIEKNPDILKYQDITLFDHQKQLFQIFGKETMKDLSNDLPKLVLYIAPTGTGKTMSPLGLSETHKVIFVCTARHVGLALARSAISMEKRVAFAFGCETASDIRLHYFAAIDYTRNWKTGAIRKVDNSVGYKVEIMICDIKSYLTAMHYMLAFNDEKDIITFWDEPTITMDLPHHDLHETIHTNWRENQISKMVLSCATLPREQEIQETIADFRCRFNLAEIHQIATHDCKKTISILNSLGMGVLPHTLFENYEDLQICARHCADIKSLLRYLDLAEIVKFIEYAQEFIQERYKIPVYFESIDIITMDKIKLYYLEVLGKLNPEKWPEIYQYMRSNQKPLFQQVGPSVKVTQSAQAPVNPFKGILITTEDAHTLTDGPTIYLAENIENIGRFYIAQSRIPEKVLADVMSKIEHNNRIQKKMDELEKKIAEKEKKPEETVDASFKGNTKRDSSDKTAITKEMKLWMDQINQFRAEIYIANIDAQYIPNSREHQQVWTKKFNENAFSPDIDDESIRTIMSLDVSSNLKLLLLLGIGMFVNQPNIQYMEIMKMLATNQKLFLIIAASDYIYGTNYQFSHGFIGKDIANMTQQKTLQALGRIGRGNIQRNYTIRFRDDSVIRRLFLPTESNLEGEVMSRLMSGASEWADENIQIIDKPKQSATCKLHHKYAKYSKNISLAQEPEQQCNQKQESDQKSESNQEQDEEPVLKQEPSDEWWN